MDILAWLWWFAATGLDLAWSLVWFLIGGWVSTVFQIALLIAIIYYLKYGWQRAPSEIWRRTVSFGGFFWGWLRAREAQPARGSEVREVVRVVRAKEFGDINLSTLLSLLMVLGILLASKL
jgi:hypothetical protein